MIRIELMSKVIITSSREITDEKALAEFIFLIEQYLNNLTDFAPALRFHFNGDTVKVITATQDVEQTALDKLKAFLGKEQEEFKEAMS